MSTFHEAVNTHSMYMYYITVMYTCSNIPPTSTVSQLSSMNGLARGNSSEEATPTSRLGLNLKASSSIDKTDYNHNKAKTIMSRRYGIKCALWRYKDTCTITLVTPTFELLISYNDLKAINKSVHEYRVKNTTQDTLTGELNVEICAPNTTYPDLHSDYLEQLICENVPRSPLLA